MSLANEYENRTVGYLFGRRPWTPPATLWLGLSTTVPQENGTGVTEPAGGGYGRLEIDNSETGNFWSTPASGVVRNLATVGYARATGAWGEITHYVLFTEAAGGEVFFSGAITPARGIATGDRMIFDPDELTVTCD